MCRVWWCPESGASPPIGGGTTKEQHHGHHRLESSPDPVARTAERGCARACHRGGPPQLRLRPGAGQLRGPALPALRCSPSGMRDMIGSAPAFALLAGVAAVAFPVPYLRDTLRRTTVPHRGSWLIWGSLEVVAVEAQRADGASWS